MSDLQLTRMEIQNQNRKKAATQNADNDTPKTNNDNSAQTLWGSHLGRRFGKYPWAFVEHSWMFHDVLTAREQLLIERLWAIQGPSGIFPSLETLASLINISLPNVCRMLNGLAKNKKKKVKCAVCGLESKVLDIKSGKPIKGGSEQPKVNRYSLKPFENWFEHIIVEHYGHEPNLKGKSAEEQARLIEQLENFREEYNKARKEYDGLNKSKDDRTAFPQKGNEF